MIVGGALILLGLVTLRRARTPDVGNLGAAVGGVGVLVMLASVIVGVFS